MRPGTVAVAAFALLACASRSPSKERAHYDLGSPSDMRTALGSHDGYVVGKCTVRQREYIFVKGTGSERILSPDWKSWTPLAMERLRVIGQGLGQGSGFGPACEGGGLIVFIESWRLMDKNIELIGESLKAANVSDAVTLEVSGPTVLL
jgi:hypothetical protein